MDKPWRNFKPRGVGCYLRNINKVEPHYKRDPSFFIDLRGYNIKRWGIHNIKTIFDKIGLVREIEIKRLNFEFIWHRCTSLASIFTWNILATNIFSCIGYSYIWLGLKEYILKGICLKLDWSWFENWSFVYCQGVESWFYQFAFKRSVLR